ncbi:unnamed protein product [Vitrella brassicaformis CCMP3155]|uniref:Uncharacterized protein n=1 Tax=Vitrella brassicaformis (strain CCMP3155) TaxID=1169540 RepID=A0A0G4EKE9_VITBC|nr:unnamed protein product [Vitrella brassicaformis CCMP3155]|eukprot:CEL96897.1 unnamed protein product [Vitrella brassicaformis CCMP3155]
MLRGSSIMSAASSAGQQQPQHPTTLKFRQLLAHENEVCPYLLGKGTEWTVTEKDARDSGGRLKVERVPHAAVGSLVYDKDWPLMSATSSAGQQPHQQQQQPQQQAMKLKAVEIHLPPDTNDATQRLVGGIIVRTITPAEVQQLIRQGADAAVYVELRECRRRVALLLCVSLLSLAIDDWSTPTALEEELTIGPERHKGEFILPLWPSREVQAAILSALIDAIGRPRIDSLPPFPGHPRITKRKGPIEMAVRAGNLTAVKTLVANGAALRGRQLVFLPRWVRTSKEYEAALMAIYTYLVQHDPSLATEATANGYNVIHLAAGVGPIYSEAFIHAFLQLMKDNGASLTHTTHQHVHSKTPLHRAAIQCSYHVIEWLCPHLSPADINERSSANTTPLTLASGKVASLVRHATTPSVRGEISGMRGAIRAMLRSGAAIDRDRHVRRLVDGEYVQLLEELADDVMDAVNGALKPQRDVADLLTRLLPLARFPPSRPKPSDATDNDAPAAPSRPSPFAHSDETAHIAWKVGAFLHEPEAVDQMHLTTHTPLAGRVKAAMQHFVKCAATKTAGNREVVGVMANVGGRVVRVPLQCFAVNRGQLTHRRLGLREVVHKARLDEAARYGLTGVVKDFNTHLGNEDCQFDWQQLGWVDERGQFQPLGIN